MVWLLLAGSTAPVVQRRFTMKAYKKLVAMAVSVIVLVGLGAGCAPGGPANVSDDAEVINMDLELEMIPLDKGPAMFEMKMPTAPGDKAKSNEKAIIDYSNTSDGYVMVKYLQKTDKQLRVRVTGPSGVPYVYTLKSNGEYEVYPLSDGSGAYTISVHEHIEGDLYSTSNSIKDQMVTLKDEFAPFLRPNQYVNFTPESKTVAKANELVSGISDFTGKISAVYNYVISNLTYDRELAADITSGKVKSGYLPDVDAVLEKGKGICFDYSAVMTAMLRSQGIPTKLVVGYAGTAYHAWINVYSEKDGWINNVIYFDGESWKLMDPTFASGGNQSDAIMQYIGDGANYTERYLY